MLTPLVARALALVALTAVATTTTTAHAGTVQIQPNVDYNRLSWVSISFDSGRSRQGELAGQLRLHRTGGTDASVKAANDFLAFCIEPTEYLTASTLTVGALATGDTAQGGMGTAKARAIARMFAGVLPDIGRSVANDVGAALQVSIWEIERETTGQYALDTGSLRASASPQIATLASQYLAYANANGHGPQLYTLRALTVTGAQDQLGQVPEPAAFCVLGLGLAGLIAARRRAR